MQVWQVSQQVNSAIKRRNLVGGNQEGNKLLAFVKHTQYNDVSTQIWPTLDPEAAEPAALLGKLPSGLPLPFSAACTDGHFGASSEDAAERSVQHSTKLRSVHKQCRRSSRYVTAPPILALGDQVVCQLNSSACLCSWLWCSNLWWCHILHWIVPWRLTSLRRGDRKRAGAHT